MMPDPAHRRPASLPDWFPKWATQLADLYFSGTTAVFVLYVLTLAPSTAMWDTSEYITAAYTLGLPHPPGNPLFVRSGNQGTDGQLGERHRADGRLFGQSFRVGESWQKDHG